MILEVFPGQWVDTMTITAIERDLEQRVFVYTGAARFRVIKLPWEDLQQLFENKAAVKTEAAF